MVVTNAPAQPWSARARDQHRAVLGSAGERRGGREAERPGDEHAALADAVADTAREQVERREHERVREEDPLPAGEPEAEVAPDPRQRDVDDRGVHGGHRRAEDGRDEHLRARVEHATCLVPAPRRELTPAV